MSLPESQDGYGKLCVHADAKAWKTSTQATAMSALKYMYACNWSYFYLPDISVRNLGAHAVVRTRDDNHPTQVIDHVAGQIAEADTGQAAPVKGASHGALELKLLYA